MSSLIQVDEERIITREADEEECEPFFDMNKNGISRITISSNKQRRNDHHKIVPLPRQRLVWFVCCLGATALLAVASSIIISATHNNSTTTTVTQRPSTKTTIVLPSLLQKLGWMDTVEYYRSEIVKVSHIMYEQDQEGEQMKIKMINDGQWNNLNDYEKYTVDISPLYDIVMEAVDTIGVKGLVFDVFTPELNEYYDIMESPKCLGSELHGYDCAYYGVWWFYHSTGAILGEKLVNDGQLLWDPMTGEYSNDFFDLQNRIHEREELPFSWEMSFHVQHGLLWYYALYYMPDMTEFPTQLVYDFCGKWVHNNTVLANGKQIGFSCAHGFGHMVFNVVANRQINPDGQYPLSARRQVKANSGFELDHDSLCQIRRICSKAKEMGEEWEKDSKEYVTNAGDRCDGGAIHSMKLMAATLPTREENSNYRKYLAHHFHEEMDICRKQDEEAGKH
jgi:hypothetical protein